jgi:hypothetical protein
MLFPVALSLPEFKTFDEYRYKISFALFMSNQNQFWKRQTFLDAKNLALQEKFQSKGFFHLIKNGSNGSNII